MAQEIQDSSPEPESAKPGMEDAYELLNRAERQATISPEELFAAATRISAARSQLTPATRQLAASLGILGSVGSLPDRNRTNLYTNILAASGGEDKVGAGTLSHRLEIIGVRSYGGQLQQAERTQLRQSRQAMLARIKNMSRYVTIRQEDPDGDCNISLQIPLDGSVSTDEYTTVYNQFTAAMAESMAFAPDKLQLTFLSTSERWQEEEADTLEAVRKGNLYEAVSSDRVLDRIEEIIRQKYPDSLVGESEDPDMSRIQRLAAENWKALVRDNILGAISTGGKAGVTAAEFEAQLYQAAENAGGQLRAKVVGRHSLTKKGALEHFLKMDETLEPGADPTAAYAYVQAVFPEHYQKGERAIFTQLGDANRWISESSVWLEYDARDTRGRTAYIDGDTGSTDFVTRIEDSVVDLSKALMIASIRVNLGGADIIEGQTMGTIDFKALPHGYEMHVGPSAFDKETAEYWQEMAAATAEKGIRVQVHTDGKSSIDLQAALKERV